MLKLIYHAEAKRYLRAYNIITYHQLLEYTLFGQEIYIKALYTLLTWQSLDRHVSMKPDQAEPLTV